jgi:short-subunit dehydrogenase
MGVNVTVVYPFWVKTKLLDSPSYGGAEVGKLPDFFVENPSRVVKAAVKGIKKKRLHVYPGPYAKLVWQAAKLCPFTSRQAH